MKKIKYLAGISQAFKIMGMLVISVYIMLSSVYLYRGSVAEDAAVLSGEAMAEETVKQGTSMIMDSFSLAECLAMAEIEQPFADFTEEAFFSYKITPRPLASRTGELKEWEAVPLQAAAVLKENKEQEPVENAPVKTTMAEASPAAALTAAPASLPPVTTEQTGMLTQAAPQAAPAPVPASLDNGQAVEQKNNYDTVLNPYVLDIIKTYRIGELKYPYLLNKDYNNYNGVTTTLTYKGKVLLKAHPSGNRASHCVGITFEVFFRAMQERNRRLGLSADDINGMSWDKLFDMALHWFVASGSKRTNNIVIAVEKYGVGKRINRFEDVQPGDFIDFNRTNGTGHTVVFINWIRQGERITGMRYWSSQGSTGGINYNEEYFSGSGGTVVRDPIYMVRILPVNEYKR